jgi:macrolide-specific efflux system membrane fusion protein
MTRFLLALLPLTFAGWQANDEIPPVNDNVLLVQPAQVTLIEQVRISAREAGIIEELSVQEGSYVKAGDQIGKLEDRQASVELQRAEAELAVRKEEATNDVNERFAKAALKVEAKELERMYRVVERIPGTISRTEIEKQELTVARTELQSEQAQHEQKLAALNAALQAVVVEGSQVVLDRHQIISTVNGIVVERFKKPGEWVTAGDDVIRIVRLDQLRIEGYLDGRFYSRDLQGRKVTLTVNVPRQGRQQFHGKVTFVSPEIEPVTNQFRIWAEVENKDLLLSPGLSGVLEISLDETVEPAAQVGSVDAE